MVAQVVAQALASLEGQVKGSVKDYVVKVSPIIFLTYYSYLLNYLVAHWITGVVGANIEAEPVGVRTQ